MHPQALETHHLDYKLIAPVFVISLSTSIQCFSSFLTSPFRNHLAENDGHLALNFIWEGVESFIDARMACDECGRGSSKWPVNKGQGL
jgi:hypothetical protein